MTDIILSSSETRRFETTSSLSPVKLQNVALLGQCDQIHLGAPTGGSQQRGRGDLSALSLLLNIWCEKGETGSLPDRLAWHTSHLHRLFAMDTTQCEQDLGFSRACRASGPRQFSQTWCGSLFSVDVSPGVGTSFCHISELVCNRKLEHIST